jgi:hypothetical protein
MLIFFRRIGSRKIRPQARSRPQIERLEGRDLPAPLTWSAGPNLHTAVGGVSASPEAGEIAVFGGGSNSVNSVGIANPSWNTTAGTFASNEFGDTSPGVGILPNYSLLVFGGNSGGAVSDAVQYDYYNSDNTNPVASMTTPRASFGFATDSNHLIYAIGGIDDNNSPLSSMEVYTQSTYTWSLLASLPQTLYGQSAAFDGNGHIFTFGGVGANGTITSNVYEYTISTNTWTTAASMPNAVRDSSAVLGSNGLLYVLGGITSTGTTASVESYNPATNSWNTESPLPNPVSDEGAVTDSLGRIEVLGGYDANGNPLANVWVSQQLNQPDSAPTITTTPPSTIAWTGYPNNYQVFSTANPPAAYSLTTAPSGMTINSTTGLVTWYPTQAQLGGTYTVSVQASNYAGQATQTYNLTVKQSPPTVPTGIYQSGETVDSATLSWNASTGPIGVDHYNIYHYYGTGHSGRGGGITYHYDLIGTSTTPTFTITGLTSGGTFSWYTITAVDPNGLSSGYSTLYTIHTLPDTVPPVLTLPPNQTVTATSPSGATDPGAFTATATDPGPGIDNITIVYAVPINGYLTQIPTSYVFPIGTTTVTAIARDMYGNYTSGNFTITVVSSFPVLTLPANQTVEQTSSAGATDSNAFTATATDPDDSIASITYAVNGTTIDPGYAFAPGTTTVTVTATDVSGYSDSGTFTVTVEDIPPTLTLTGLTSNNNTVYEGTAINVTANATAGTPAENAAGLSFTWNVTKVHNGVTTNNYFTGSGTGSSDAISFIADDEGTYTLNVTATDVNGTSTTVSPTITSWPLEPTFTISGPSDGVVYQNRVFTFTASSPSPIDQASPFTYNINWGDGNTQTITGGSSIVVGHVYTAAGSYSVSAYPTDAGGFIGPTSTQSVSIGTIELQSDTAGRGGITGLAIGGTGGNDNFVISTGSTSGTVSVTLNGVNLGTFTPTGGGIDVYNSPGTNSITFKSPSGAGAYFLDGQTLTYSNTGTGVPHFKLSLHAAPDIGQLIVKGGNTASSYTIQDATIATNITAGGGNDTFTLADTGAATQPVTINGGLGTNALTAASLANSWSITAANTGRVQAALEPADSFSYIQNLTGGSVADTFAFAGKGSIAGSLHGGSAGTLDLSHFTTSVSLNLQMHKVSGVGGTSTSLAAVVGGSGTNTLTGANAANTWNLTGSNKGTINGTFTFTAFANLQGGTAGNDFVFSDGQGVTGRITGGGTSGNKLDYSAYSTGIYVNLHSGVATGTAGVSKIQQVHGGNGNDILVGYGSGIVLQAGAGNDLIIGGSGRASLQSGSGQDIVIAGSTSYDTNAAALNAIESYWSNTSMDETTRYHQLSTLGTPTGGYKLTPATVKHAAASDTLALGSGHDWLFWRMVGSSDLDSVSGTPEFSTFT